MTLRLAVCIQPTCCALRTSRPHAESTGSRHQGPDVWGMRPQYQLRGLKPAERCWMTEQLESRQPPNLWKMVLRWVPLFKDTILWGDLLCSTRWLENTCFCVRPTQVWILSLLPASEMHQPSSQVSRSFCSSYGCLIWNIAGVQWTWVSPHHSLLAFLPSFLPSLPPSLLLSCLPSIFSLLLASSFPPFLPM